MEVVSPVKTVCVFLILFATTTTWLSIHKDVYGLSPVMTVCDDTEEDIQAGELAGELSKSMS